MSGLTPLFALLAILAATLGAVGVWSPRRLSVKVGALLVAFALMGTGYAAMLDLLSKPKPASFEWLLSEAREATVLGNSMVEDKAIYLWLQLDGVKEPRAYELPWDRRTAEQQSALRMRLPFERSLDDRDPRFYALPQPALPPKDALTPPPRIVPVPGSDA